MLGELWSFQGRYRTLHLTWFAFFLTFVVWFNLAPLATTVKQDMGLTLGQIRTIAICNVALTVPARVVIGMLLDKFGPRITYSAILVFSAIPCLMFATAQTFGQLVVARLLLSIVGAGFVIGIRMVAEWFPPKEIGLAEGIYGGWGNFGSAFSALSLVIVAGWLSFAGGAQIGDVVLNWRGAIALTGIVAAVYGFFYFFNVSDTPPGRTYQRPMKTAGLEVTSMTDFWGLMGMNVPFAAILAVLAWRLNKVGFLDDTTYPLAMLAVLAWYVFQSWGIIRTNKDLITGKKVYPEGRPLRIPAGGDSGTHLYREFRLRTGGGVDAARLFRKHLRAAQGHSGDPGVLLRLHEPRGPARRRVAVRQTGFPQEHHGIFSPSAWGWATC